MAANDAKRDQNHVTTLLAVTNDSAKEVRKLLVNPDNDKLLVEATVSGSVTTGGLTDAQLRATAVPVSLTSTTITGTVAVTQSTSPWVVSLASTTITGSVAVTGTFFQATQPVSLSSLPALVAGTAQIGSTIPDLAASGLGRTRVQFASVNQTSDATVYTVTSAKDLYVKWMEISVMNTSAAAMGRLTIKDGGSTGTIIKEINLPTAVAGQIAPHAEATIIVPDDAIVFGTDIFADVQQGTLTYSVAGGGYEQ